MPTDEEEEKPSKKNHEKKQHAGAEGGGVQAKDRGCGKGAGRVAGSQGRRGGHGGALGGHGYFSSNSCIFDRAANAKGVAVGTPPEATGALVAVG